MAYPVEEKCRGSPKGKRTKGELKSKLSLFEQIEELAYYDARNTNNETQTLKFLQSWWAKHYNRPLKDPILLSYTIEELIYEYYNTVQRAKAADERVEEENDMIEEAKLEAEAAWADEMEKEEADAEKAKKPAESKPSEDGFYDPLSDPKNLEWVNKIIEDEKEKVGEDFGEDLSVNFEDS